MKNSLWQWIVFGVLVSCSSGSSSSDGGAGGTGGSAGAATGGGAGMAGGAGSAGTAGAGGVAGTGGTGGSGGTGAIGPMAPRFCPDTPFDDPPASAVTATAPSVDWVVAVGTDDTERPSSLAVLSDGVVVSVDEGFVDTGLGTASSEKGVVRAVQPDGTVRWSLDGPVWMQVAADAAGNVYVAGVAQTESLVGTERVGGDTPAAYVVALASGGTPAWSKTFDGVTAVALTAVDGGVVVVGAFSTPIDLGGGLLEARPEGSHGVFAARLDTNGDHVWSTAYGGTEGTVPLPPDGTGGVGGRSIVEDAVVESRDDGSVIVLTSFSGTLELPDRLLLNDGVTTDLAVVSLDAAGDYAWSAHVRSLLARNIPNQGTGGISGFIPEAQFGAVDLAVAPSGAVAVSGTKTGEIDVEGTRLVSDEWGTFTAVLEAGGALRAAADQGGVAATLPADDRALVFDGKVVSGLDVGASDFGTQRWSLTPTAFHLGRGLLEYGGGASYLAVEFAGRADVAGTRVDSAGCEDVLVAKLSGP